MPSVGATPCLCGASYPNHLGEASVVSYGKRAGTGSEPPTQWRRSRAAAPWAQLSSPRTYLSTDPSVTGSPDFCDYARLFWQRLLNAEFEGDSVVVAPADRGGVRLDACSKCSTVCCEAGSPIVSGRERDLIVNWCGFPDYFVSLGADERSRFGLERLVTTCPATRIANIGNSRSLPVLRPGRKGVSDSRLETTRLPDFPGAYRGCGRLFEIMSRDGHESHQRVPKRCRRGS